MKRFFPALFVLALAGCEQARPPSAAVVAARTAKGPKNTNFETKIQPEVPLAGTTSIWNFKVFDLKNKPDGSRKEWKFFNALPQSSSDKTTTQVLMNAWLISNDKRVFLPQKPNYAQYGSFLTDWVVPVPGSYTLWVEYQPVIAKDELSFQDFQNKAKILPIEHARWNVTVKGANTSSTKPLTPAEHGSAFGIYSLGSSDYGASTTSDLSVDTNFKLNQSVTLRPTISPASNNISDQAVTALSPDGKMLLHAVGNAPRLTFTQRGTWRAWFSFSLDGKSYAAPVDLNVS